MMHPEPDLLTLHELRIWIKQNHPHKIKVTRLAEMWQDPARRQEGSRLRSQMIGWCSRQFGQSIPSMCVNRSDSVMPRTGGFLDPRRALYTYNPRAEWTQIGYNFHFADPNAALHFKMRWW